MIRNVTKPLGSIRVACAVAVGLPLFFVSNAFAQEPSPAPTVTTGSNIPSSAGAGTSAEVERVVVTGSNIPSSEEVGPNPVDTYRKDDITRMGVRSATDLVQKLPAATGSTINENNTNGGDGRAEINLRGILAKETLVLQDGRRLAPVGFAGSTVDINTFPVGLIDHVDVLKDGASAIYGSDAVAGVVNFYMIHNFRGMEIYASYGDANLGGSQGRAEERAYILAGTGDDKTNIVVYAEWYNRAAVFSRDRDVSHNPEDFVNFGGVDTRSGNYAGRVGGFAFFPQFNGGRRSPTPHAFPNAANDPEYTSIFARGPHHAFFNFLALTPAIAATDREYLYGSFTRDVCDKYLTVFADFKYARTFWDGGLAPTPFTPDVWTDQNRPFGISNNGVSFSVPIQNAFNPFTVPNYISPGGVAPGFPQNQVSAAPAGTQFTTGVRFRGLEAGLRTDKILTDNYLFTAGMRCNLGEFSDYTKTWDWEVGFRWNEDHRLERFGGIINNNALRAALLDTDPATAFNPFGRNQNSQAVVDKVFVTTNHTGSTSLALEDFKLNGELFNMPAGPLAFAVGSEHRTEHASDNPDALTASGQTTGATNFSPTKGSRDVWSVYIEGRIPITSPQWNVPYVLYSLEATAQWRYDYFSDFGETGGRPKFSLRWQPFDSALTIRATYNEAFHAPTLGELFSGVAQSFPNVNDPFSEPQVEQHLSGNPNLKPETAYEWTYGAICSPGKWWSALQGLTVSADFYHIDLRGVTVTLDPQVLIDNENLFPTQVIRQAGPGTPIVLLLTPEQNLGRFIQEGWDYEAVYTFETGRLGHGDWGTLTTTFNGTYIDRAVIQLIPGGPETIAVGKFGGGFLGPNGGGSLTHNRWYSSLFYDGPAGSWLAGVDTGFTVHFVGQYWDDYGFRFFDATPLNGGLGEPTGPRHHPQRFFVGKEDRKIREWITLDYIINYTFSFPAPAGEVPGQSKDGGKTVVTKEGKDKNVLPVSTAEYNPCGWRAWLNNVTLTAGVNNVFDEEPPFVAAAFENGYDEQTATIAGRTYYLAIKKRF